MSTTTRVTHPDGTVIETTTADVPSKPGGTLKTYWTCTGIPNPVIVDVAAAELGVDLDPFDRQVDVVGAENRTPEMLKKNPSGGIPFLELTDGTYIGETVAIAAYLEDAESTNGVSLFGTTPKDKAVIRQWSRRIEQQIAIVIMNWFRWGPAKDLFKDRGAHANLGNDEAAALQLNTVKTQMKWLDDLMVEASNTFICGDDITICDCILWGQLFFFAESPAFGAPLKEHTFDNADLDIPWIKKWYEMMKARPTVAKLYAKYTAPKPEA